MTTAGDPARGGEVVRSRTLLGLGGRWVALAVLAGSELLIVLDATIVNVALPAIQADLDVEGTDLQWVVTAYVLAFGGFLLLGGRLVDRFGRRRMFIAAASVFALGSLLAGLAPSMPALIAGRALQGLAAAGLAPSALSLVMVVFTEGPQRDRALGIWGGVAASGTVMGLLLGGVLTQALSWRWVFWASAPIAAGAALLGRTVLPESTKTRGQGFDLAGAVLGTGGLIALVYALVRTPELGWVSAPTLSVLLLAAGLLVAFGWLQRNRRNPLVPMRLLRDRNVLGADLVGLAAGAAIYALFYFLSLFLGGPLGYGALRIGLAFLPLAVALAAAAQLAGRMMGQVAPRSLVLAGTLIIGGGLALLGGIDPQTSYPATLLPALICVGVGMGLAFVALTSVAVGAVAEQDSGIASGMFTAAQQIGGALGLAVLTALSTVRTHSLSGNGANPGPHAVTAGWSLGFLVAAGVMVLAAVATMTMISNGRRTEATTAAARPG